MKEKDFRNLSIFSLFIATALAYLSLFLEPRMAFLSISFVLGLAGILGLLYLTRPGYNPPL